MKLSDSKKIRQFLLKIIHICPCDVIFDSGSVPFCMCISAYVCLSVTIRVSECVSQRFCVSLCMSVSDIVSQHSHGHCARRQSANQLRVSARRVERTMTCLHVIKMEEVSTAPKRYYFNPTTHPRVTVGHFLPERSNKVFIIVVGCFADSITSGCL